MTAILYMIFLLLCVIAYTYVYNSFFKKDPDIMKENHDDEDPDNGGFEE